MLGWVYQSSLVQFGAMILVLGLTGRQVVPHRFMLSGILCSCFSLLIWSLAPSFGPSPYVMLDPAIELRLGRVVDPAYAGQLMALLRDGAGTIDANHLIGLIAFPSMHTVMAATAVWYSRGTQAVLAAGSAQPCDGPGDPGPWRTPSGRRVRRAGAVRGGGGLGPPPGSRRTCR